MKATTTIRRQYDVTLSIKPGNHVRRSTVRVWAEDRDSAIVEAGRVIESDMEPHGPFEVNEVSE